ncbi:MAG: lytic murein transglycosylase, partial [Kineosporiaceae bacterium]
MKKTLAVVVVLAAALIVGMPLLIAVFVAAIAGPAAGEELPAISCTVAEAPGASALADAGTTPAASTPPAVSAGIEEGGVGFALPPPGTPRRDSLRTPPLPIPPPVRAAYLAAADRYTIPWTLLAGIGMEESGHGRTTATSPAGAQGPMQFLPAAWAVYGVDGNGDGRAVVTDIADAAMSAANYLTAAGVSAGPAGVRRALAAYDHDAAYVNDVLSYAHAYGGGTVLGEPNDCTPGTGDPDLPPLTTARITTVLTWAVSKIGDPYVFGAAGPHAWDCSSYTRAAYTQIGVTLPRTAAGQRNWLAAGNGYRIPPGQERPGDLVFADTYLGPNTIGHVM